MEPVGLIASLISIAKASGDAMAVIGKALPETSRFWKHFEENLKNDHDVPWATIRSQSYLQPAFFGLAMGLIYGVEESRSQMEAHFASFVEPPEGGRYSKDELVQRIMAVAEEAAAEAARSDRIAGLASRRLLEERIAEAARVVGAAVAPLSPQLQTVSQKLDRVLAELSRQAEWQDDLSTTVDERLSEISELLTQVPATLPPPSRASVDREEMQALLNAQVDEVQRRSEETLRRFLEPRPTPPPDQEPLADNPPAESAEAVSAPLGSPIADAASAEKRLDHIAVLRDEDPGSADRLQGLQDERGVFGVTTAIRDGEFDDGPLPLLVAAARTVAEGGFLADAESAYLRAARVADDIGAKARQHVRAASMASAQGSEERFRRHLDTARDLVPNHPALLIAEARASADSRFMLDHLAEVEPENEVERALLHQTRAQALLNLGDEDGAQAEYELARQADASNDAVREFGGILPWYLAHRQLERGESVDPEPLRRAASTFEALASQIGAQGRIDEAAKLMARAAECHLFAHDPREAERVLESVSDPERISLESALNLANVAVLANRPDLVPRFVPASAGESRARLVRAEAQAQGPSTEARGEGVAGLRGLLDDANPDIAGQAAFGLLTASAMYQDVAWDARAADVVAERKPAAEAAMRAERAMLLDDAAEAQRILLPHVARIQALRRLRDYAALAGEWEKVKDRSRELLRRADDPRDRLALAEAFRNLGEPGDAEREFSALARDGEVSAELREAAFGALTELVGVTSDYEGVRAVAEEWRAALPTSSNALWNSLFAMARLSRHAEAWALVQAEQPIPDTATRATLLAEILHRAAPKLEAVRRLIELSDHFDQQVEALEALIIATALDAEHDEIAVDADVEARVRETFAAFPSRFPESQVIRAVPAPTTREEIKSFFGEILGDRPRLQEEVGEAITAGRAPVNALAAVSSGGIGKTWSQLRALPLGFAMAERDEPDREAARVALGAAVVWDSSSLFVVTDLDGEVEGAIRTMFPGSMVVTETLEDADRDVSRPGKPSAETLHTPSGDFAIREIPEEELEQDARRTEETLRLVRELEIRPAKGSGSDADLVKAFEDSEGQPEFRALFGTLLLAQRTGRPIYSDDRFIREAARSLGLKAFGTLAVIDIMVEEGVLDGELRRTARRKLAARGGWGLQLDGAELIAAGIQDNFALTPTTGGAVQDRARWRSDPARTWRDMLAFLAAVYDQAPEAFGGWVRRVLDAAQVAGPEITKSWWLEVMMLVAWWPPQDGPDRDTFFQALVDEAKHLPLWLTDLGYDPVLGPIARMLSDVEDQGDAERFGIFRLLFSRLRLDDQVRAFFAFVRV